MFKKKKKLIWMYLRVLFLATRYFFLYFFFFFLVTWLSWAANFPLHAPTIWTNVMNIVLVLISVGLLEWNILVPGCFGILFQSYLFYTFYLFIILYTYISLYIIGQNLYNLLSFRTYFSLFYVCVCF